MEQWHDTESALAKLYRYAEGRAIEATDWYLQDKRGKRIWSRGLRLLAILLVIAGALQPLLDAAAPGPSRTAWGYVLLALAAACIGFDRFFGLSSGWMRSMTTAQSLERRLEQLQYDWAAECARSASRTVDPKQVQNRLALLRAFSDDVAALLQQETAEWVLEFATCCASSAPTAAVPGRYHCRAPPSPRRPGAAMPTDHGPELEALRKRLADAKEFL
jgi:hypothetical protein